MNCVFCDYLKLGERIFENELCFAIFDRFPVKL